MICIAIITSFYVQAETLLVPAGSVYACNYEATDAGVLYRGAVTTAPSEAPANASLNGIRNAVKQAVANQALVDHSITVAPNDVIVLGLF
jgi:hypothetical protein